MQGLSWAYGKGSGGDAPLTFRLAAERVSISAGGSIAGYVDRIYASGNGKGLYGARIIKGLRAARTVDHINGCAAGVFALGIQGYPMKNRGISGLAPRNGGVVGSGCSGSSVLKTPSIGRSVGGI